MALEYRNGKPCYYRKKRKGNKVVSEYLGSGETAILLYNLDKKEQQEKELKRELLNKQRAPDNEAEDELKELESNLTQLFTCVALASGYHKPKQQWRKKRLKY